MGEISKLEWLIGLVKPAIWPNSLHGSLRQFLCWFSTFSLNRMKYNCFISMNCDWNGGEEGVRFCLYHRR
jgi:hypothetical protein